MIWIKKNDIYINIYELNDDVDYQNHVYGQPIKTVTNMEDVKKIENALANAEKTDGLFDLAAAQYVIEIVETSMKKTYYLLWISADFENASAMKNTDSNTIYVFSISDTEFLKEIIFNDN